MNAPESSPPVATNHDPKPVERSRPARFAPRRVLVLLAKLLPVLLVLGIVGYVRFFRPVPAAHAKVTRGDIVEQVFGRGTLESPRQAELGFDMSGRLSDILVDEGDRVQLGQVLAHLAPRQFEAELSTAKSGASVARAALARLDADEKRAAATLTFAQSEAERARSLASSGSVSARDLDMAEQQLALARAEVERVKAARAEATRQIDVARGGVELQKAVTMRTALVSPYDGLVIRRFRDPGDTVAIGTTVLRVVATDRLWVRAWIDETALDRLVEGQHARVTFPGEPGSVYEGVVDRIGREADRQTHELLVDVRLSRLPERVAIGQRADVRIELGKNANALQLPTAFLFRRNAASFAYVSRGGRIGEVPIETGAAGADVVEVKSGVQEGDVVLRPATPGGELPAGRRWKAASGS